LPLVSASALIAGLARALDERKSSGLWRFRRTVDEVHGPRVRIDGRELLAFASNDYLGLAGDERVVEALRAGASRFGAGSAASHLICGHMRPHADLESALAHFVAPQAEARALLLSTGYLANLAICTALLGRGDVIFADRLNHASLNDAALLSRAELVRYPHRDLASLASRLASSGGRIKAIVTDAVFSMDGDVAPLASLARLADQHGAWLLVDDAHGFGVRGGGRGSLSEESVCAPHVVYMGTLGKAAGVAGAFVVAHPTVVETIVQRARPYIYTTAAPPALAMALLASLEAIEAASEPRAHLHRLIAHFRSGARALPWPLMPSDTPIQPIVIGSPEHAVGLAEALWDEGLWVPAIRPPTVPNGTARLRVSLSAAHAIADVDRLLSALARAAAASR
jgi:8-amino-7-oxononanoate synthase